MIKFIPFTEWAPDVALVQEGYMPVVINAVPAPFGYEPAIVATGDTYGTYAGTSVAPGRSATDKSGDPYFFIGTTTQIYRASATATFDNVSGTTAYGSGAVATWDFVQWGDDMLATNFVDPIQSMMIAATAMADLNPATSTPKAKWITTARNFVIIGNTVDSTDGTSPNRVRWSALGDSTDWTVSAVTQADYDDLESSQGVVQRVFGGEYGIVFQERAITRMSYVGTPAIWQFDTVQPGTGLFAPYAAAQRGDKIFFLSQDGFYVLLNGSEARPIGRSKITKAFFTALDDTNKAQITCAIDPRSTRVYWQYPTLTNGLRDVIVYDYTLDKWGFIQAAGLTRPSEFLSDIHGSALAMTDGSNVGLLNSLATTTMKLQTSALKLTADDRGAMTRFLTVRANSINTSASVGPGSVLATFISGRTWREAEGNITSLNKNESGSMRNSGRIAGRVSGRLHKFNLEFTIARPSIEDSTEVTGIDVEYVPTSWR